MLNGKANQRTHRWDDPAAAANNWEVQMRWSSLWWVFPVVLALSACGSSGTEGDGGTNPGQDGGTGAPCGLQGEPEPNEDRDNATAYTFATELAACIGDRTDVDFYQFTAPADLTGGYVQVALTEVGDGLLEAIVYAASDNGQIVRVYAANRGQSVLLYFSAAPGQTYRLQVKDWTGFRSAYRYTLRATYTQVEDAYEPNDSRPEAKPISIGTPIQAFLFAGSVSGTFDPDQMQDWYQVTAAAGNLTAQVSDVPTDSMLDVYLFDGAGTQLAYAYNATKGGSVTTTRNGIADGTYYVRIRRWGTYSAPHGSGDILPDRFTRPYTLTVTQ
jgi:hypothetical protein